MSNADCEKCWKGRTASAEHNIVGTAYVGGIPAASAAEGLAADLVHDVIAKPGCQAGYAAGNIEISVIDKAADKRAAIVERVVIQINCALAIGTIVGDIGHVDATVIAGIAAIGRGANPDVIDHIVVGLNLSFRWIHRGKVNPVTGIVVNQVVMDR